MCGHFKVFLSKRLIFLSLFFVFVLGIVCVFTITNLYAQSSGVFNGSVRLGFDNRTCTSAIEGGIRYNSSAGSSGALQYCDGLSWKNWGE